MDSAEVDRYARAAARLAGLAIDDAGWPIVAGHLAVLLDHAAGLEAGQAGTEDQAPVFRA